MVAEIISGIILIKKDVKEKMYIFPTYFTEKLKIDFMQRVILLHSYIYYEHDKNIWTDKQFDSNAIQLVEMQAGKTEEWIKQKTQYGYVFYDFDGTTGFDLWGRLNKKDKQYLSNIAERMLKDEAKQRNKTT